MSLTSLTFGSLGLPPLIGLPLTGMPDAFDIRTNPGKHIAGFFDCLILRRSNGRSPLGVFLADGVIALRALLDVDVTLAFAHAPSIQARGYE